MRNLPRNTCALIALLVLATGCHREPVSSRAFGQEPEDIYQGILANLDPQHPGRGRDSLSQEPRDFPMGYAMVLSAEAARYRATGDASARERAETCADWLFDHADRDGDGVIGYGLPVPWDAFSDGTTNAAHHEYTITTAIVLQGLLDWAEVEPSAEAKVVKIAMQCLEPYLSGAALSPSGLYAYSLSGDDLGYDVFNPAAYMTGQMQRLASRLPEESAISIRSAAARQVEILLRNHQSWPESGSVYWNYGIQVERPSDLVHALYIVEGLRTYRVHGGTGLDEELWRDIERHHADFEREGTYCEHIVKRMQTRKRNMRSWALGMLFVTLAEQHEGETLSQVMETQLPRYLRADGGIAFRENDPAAYIRHETHVLYGLSRLLYP